MLLQQQQKQHCLFTKHKTDRKTNNIIHQIAQQQNNYYKKTNIYENHYFTWIFSSFFKHHKRTFCLLFKTFILLKPFFFLQILLNFYCNYFHLITTTCCELCMWTLIFCDNYYIFKYYFLVFINKVFALNQFVFIFREPTRLSTFIYFQDYYYYF